MPVSTQHSVVQVAPKAGDPAHPKLKAGDYHLKGTLEANGVGELCYIGNVLAAEAISLSRTASGGIAYEFAISKSDGPGYNGPDRRVLLGLAPDGKERRGVASPAQAAANAKFNKRLNVKAH
jgi:hypothetical protein